MRPSPASPNSQPHRPRLAVIPCRKNGFDVESYGTGSCIKLPGPSADKPNVFEFGKATYAEIYDTLSAKDHSMCVCRGALSRLGTLGAVVTVWIWSRKKVRFVSSYPYSAKLLPPGTRKTACCPCWTGISASRKSPKSFSWP